MKCEKHNTEMRWEGDMLTGGPVCDRCRVDQSVQGYSIDSRSSNSYRQTGRTTDALKRLFNYCEATKQPAIYIVHNDGHMSYCLDILESLGCKRISSKGSVTTPRGAIIVVRSLDYAEENPNAIKGVSTEVDHFIGEEEQFRERLMRMPDLWGRTAVPPLPPGDGVSE